MVKKGKFDTSFDDVLKSDLRKYIGKIKKIENGGALYPLVIDIVEKSLLDVALTETAGNQTEASHILGVNRNTLRRKIKDHKISLAKYSSNGHSKNGHK